MLTSLFVRQHRGLRFLMETTLQPGTHITAVGTFVPEKTGSRYNDNKAGTQDCGRFAGRLLRGGGRPDYSER